MVSEEIMRRFLLFAAVLFYAGIVFTSISFAARAASVIAAAAYIIYLVLKGSFKKALCAALLPFIGFLFFTVQKNTVTNSASKYYNTTPFILARVEGTQKGDGYSYADVFLYEAGRQKPKGRVNARIYGDGAAALSRGDVISGRVYFYEPSEGKNFGDYNAKLSLLSKGIGLSGKFEKDDINVVGKRFSYFSPYDLGFVIKTAVDERADKYLKGSDKGMAKALLTGDKSSVPPVLQDSFRVSGMAHMVAVSGMHINIVLAFITGFFALAKMKRSKPALFISLVLMWLFVFVSGCSPSSVRAAIMSTLLLLSTLAKKDNDSINSLGASAFLIMLANPASAFDMGFLLSCAATFSVLVFAEPVKQRLELLPGTLSDVLSVSLSAQIATIPVLTYMTGRVSLFGIVPNIIICPIMPFIMIVCILAVVLGGVPVIGAAVLWTAKTIISGMNSLSLVISRVPHGTAILGTPGVLRIAAFSFLCAVLYFLLAGKKTLKTGAFLAAALSLYAVLFMYPLFSETAEFTFLNVGHGDCMIFRSNKITVMFDSGGSEVYDTAGDTVIPYLDKQGIRKIDAAFITHYHADHCKAYVKLVSSGRIKRMVMPDGVYYTPYREEIIKAADKSKTRLSFIKGGERFSFGDISVCTLNTYRGDDINNGFVYAVSYGECSAFIAGDVNKDGEKRAVPFAAGNKCDILKVAHHGSATSSGSTFIKAAGAFAAVISASPYDNVADETRKVLGDNKIKIYETARNGTIEFKADKQRFLSVKTKLEKG